MSVKHDENKDLRLVSRVAFVDYSTKTIKLYANAIIGNKTWGRLDFLANYCGWFVAKSNMNKKGVVSFDDGDQPARKKKEIDHMNKSRKK